MLENSLKVSINSYGNALQQFLTLITEKIKQSKRLVKVPCFRFIVLMLFTCTGTSESAERSVKVSWTVIVGSVGQTGYYIQNVIRQNQQSVAVGSIDRTVRGLCSARKEHKCPGLPHSEVFQQMVAQGPSLHFYSFLDIIANATITPFPPLPCSDSHEGPLSPSSRVHGPRQ